MEHILMYQTLHRSLQIWYLIEINLHIFHFTEFKSRVHILYFHILSPIITLKCCYYKAYKYMNYEGKLMRLSEFLSNIWIFKTKKKLFGQLQKLTINILIQDIRLCADTWKPNIQGSLLSFILCKRIFDTSNLFPLCGYQIGNHDIIVLTDVVSLLLF